MNRRSFLQITWFLASILALLALPLSSLAAPASQGQTIEEQAQALLEQLSPEEKVGQLFLVSFQGTNTSTESQIYDLIANYHVGGVVLKAENDNFTAEPDTISDAWRLIRNLQITEWQAADRQQVDPVTGEPFTPTYIPLIIGISQEGDGHPNDQILSGLTPLPNAMALGATWDTALAQQVGQVLGRELSALGINMLLGPSLDVLENPNPESLGDLGTRTFGGDPFWVGQMASAFISGVHQGGRGQIAVVGKHFPGHGSSDRPPEEEIPTVRKSLEQLTQIELAPFFAVTGNAPSDDARLDGLLLAHIRYQGFQGNIRATTRPVSFDPQAFGELMKLEPLAAWRQAGGVIVSDQLGTRAVRRFYDPTEQNFTALDAQAVVREAILAGNDLLYLGNFAANEHPDSYTTVISVLEFFAQKYRDDVAFAQRVDQSVLRILTLKLRLHREFTLTRVLSLQSRLSDIGGDNQVAFEIARQAATLFSPDTTDLDAVLPSNPSLNDRVVFFTDLSPGAQCSACPDEQLIGKRALEQAVTRLYGQNGAGQILSYNLTSFAFSELTTLLDDASSDPYLQNKLDSANWVIFAMLAARADDPSSQALRRLLTERPGLIQDKKVIVFAFNAPYYLGATDISKLTAYYGLYSKQSEFIDVAARLLFKEISAPGASPVSISGIGYDLITATSPDPQQIVPLFIERVALAPQTGEEDQTPVSPTLTAEVAESSTSQPTPEIEMIPEYLVGERLTVRTGTIVDHNGHPVPDNTPVHFLITTTTIEGAISQKEIATTTLNGSAQTTYLVETSGTLEIKATSGEPAASSAAWQANILAVEGVVEEGEPTPLPTPQPSPIPSPTVSPSESEAQPRAGRATFGDWFLALLVSASISLAAYQAGAMAGQVRWGIRWALTTLIGGQLANTYLALGLPGTFTLLQTTGTWGAMLIILLGATIGWGTGWLWRRNNKAK